MAGGCPTRKREQQFQPGMLEPCAVKGARTVLRGRGSGDTASLPDKFHNAQAGQAEAVRVSQGASPARYA